MQSFFSSSTTFYYYTSNDYFTLPRHTAAIPIDSPRDGPVPVPVLLPNSETAAAVKIQAAYRSHLVRTLVRRILAVDSEAAQFESLIRLQDTVDAVRRDERERLIVSEGLMALLLRLDSVPGFYPAVRELRRSVSRRIVGLQEILDAVTKERVEGLNGFPVSWEDVLYGMGGGGGGEAESRGGGEERGDVEGGYQCFGIERFLLP